MGLKGSITSPFSKFLSSGKNAARAEGDQDDERKQRDDESDEDYEKRMRELDEKLEEEEEERKREEDARRAEQEEQDKEKARRAEKEGDDADSEDDETDSDAKAARQRERVRCARIMAHGIKVGASRQAGVFAFDTTMSSKAAIRALNASMEDAPGRRRAGLAERMASTSVSKPGAGGAGTNAPTLAQRIIQAGKVRRGED